MSRSPADSTQAGIMALKRVLQRRVHEQGATVVLTSPVPEIVEEIASRIIILRDGEVVAADTLEGLAPADGPGRLARDDPGTPALPGNMRRSWPILRGAEAMIRWFHVVLPSLLWVVTLAVLYVCAALWVPCLEWYYGVQLDEVRGQMSWPVLMGGTIAYAFWRAIGFHPLFRPAYATWLAASPWTSRKPLPLGPIHLVLQDVLLLGAVAFLAWLNGNRWALLIPQFFLIFYLAILGGSLFLTGDWPWGFAVAFGLGFIVWLWRSLPGCLSAAVLTYVAGYFGLRRSLARFPWETNSVHKWLMQVNRPGTTRSR